ncbi:MAG: hypothetical protein EBU66_07605 [Bacteroidetes bacterium]|nr:hypothetical protein [Bacteroidota bacterium]
MEAVPPMSYPRERGSPVHDLPLKAEGPIDFFPAVCLKTHWDPTAILKRTLPEGYVAQQTDPRPWTRICMEYTTAGEAQEPHVTNPDIVMPNGGQFYPPDRYVAAIDDESKLRVLDRPLGTCEGNQWEPSLRSDMFNSRILVPLNAVPSDPSKIQELAYPRALLRSGPYDCREMNDKYNMSVSSDFLFNNATKQDRYKQMNKPHRPGAPEEALKAAPELMRPDLTFNVSAIDPKNPLKTYEQSARNQRQELLVGSSIGPEHIVSSVPTNPSRSDPRFNQYDSHFAPRG